MSAVAGRARGFVIPYRYADSVEAPGSYPGLVQFFESAEPEFRAAISAAASYLDRLKTFGREKPPAPRFEQDWFPRLDAAIAYALVRTLRPARIVEIGSGHSTRFLARAVADEGCTTRIVAIDPAPRAALEGLPIEFIRMTLQRAGLGPFDGLSAGDIVVIDSSHILMPGTDVDLLLNTVLPALPPGVHVHIHDVFLPDGYPQDWAWRGYNEQNAIASLIATGAYRLRWASHYAATRMAADVSAAALDTLALPHGAHESGLWLVKR
jgi:Methyltransferase domain